ncbi:DUF3048 domain-containing protein [Bailinhaonella thermotolerans]|uniref:DUF3048 domain-containing protein n=1 Tax=Bailinhaonella thermotolerans TaxID=1070861 RepID=UPI001F5BC448|nr:DUF3048 domain-containing protein [Bailinhaonella thermotolerans]
MRARRKFIVLLAGAAVAAPLAACSDDPPKPATASPPSPASSAPAPTPTPPAAHPFTGKPGGQSKPVLAVKIENTASGKPQLGLRSADIVYIEQVEGGLTRLMAMFSSKIPAKVGPVRSARISDLHILRQFGKPAFAYSGVQTRMKPFVAKAPLFDVSDSAAPGAYFRQPGRHAPYNLFARPKVLLSKARKATVAKDIGWTFSEQAPEGGKPTTSFKVRYPAARFTFTWSDSEKRWLVTQDGKKDMAAEGGQLGGQTVVIQWAKTTRSQFHDVNGSYTPLIKTTGTGKATVLRDGMAYQAKWERLKENEGTTFTTPDGRPLPFAPGQVWVVLASPKPVQP